MIFVVIGMIFVVIVIIGFMVFVFIIVNVGSYNLVILLSMFLCPSEYTHQKLKGSHQSCSCR